MLLCESIAVAAKLANPSLSLFEALKIGGFDYPNDNVDASTLDSDMVKLGQRKNQLNRRLRSARQQRGSNTPTSPETTPKANASHIMMSQQSPDLLLNPEMACAKEQQQATKWNSKRSHPASSRYTEDKILGARTQEELHNERPSKTMRLTEASLAFHEVRGVGNNQEPSTCQIVSDSDTTNSNTNSQFRRNVQSEFPLLAMKSMPSHVSTMTTTLHPQQQGQSETIAPPGGGGMNVLSLLQQSQQVFGRQSNLNEAMVSRPLRQEEKHDIAMRHFTNELHGLYQQCLLKAGFSLEEASPSSFVYRKFTVDTWTTECQRLQTMLSNTAESTCSNPAGCSVEKIDIKKAHQIFPQSVNSISLL